MELTIVTDCRYVRVPDGHVYSESSINYNFLRRYLDTFESVKVIARVRQNSSPLSEVRRADGPGIHFVEIPSFGKGTVSVRHFFTFIFSIYKALSSTNACILRVPGVLGFLAWLILSFKRHSYGLEVISDPYDVFFSRNIGDKVLQALSSFVLRLQCRRAAAVAYVTQYAIQERYPPGEQTYQTYYSSIDLPKETLVSTLADRFERWDKRFEVDCFASIQITLGFIGTFNHLYKAPDIHIMATCECIARGYNIQLRMLGDGVYRHDMETMARDLGIQNHVVFLGQVPPGKPVLDFLDKVDIFLCASRGEGLPRALIEAMARGCPAIGSNVSGIPELLPSDALVAPGDYVALADKICDSIKSRNIMNVWASKNLEKAKEYTSDILQSRRILLYNHVRERTTQDKGR